MLPYSSSRGIKLGGGVCTVDPPTKAQFLVQQGTNRMHYCLLPRQKISGVPKIERNSNPATWMMEVTSTSMEAQSNIDFASTYQESSLHRYIWLFYSAFDDPQGKTYMP